MWHCGSVLHIYCWIRGNSGKRKLYVHSYCSKGAWGPLAKLQCKYSFLWWAYLLFKLLVDRSRSNLLCSVCFAQPRDEFLCQLSGTEASHFSKPNDWTLPGCDAEALLIPRHWVAGVEIMDYNCSTTLEVIVENHNVLEFWIVPKNCFSLLGSHKLSKGDGTNDGFTL